LALTWARQRAWKHNLLFLGVRDAHRDRGDEESPLVAIEGIKIKEACGSGAENPSVKEIGLSNEVLGVVVFNVEVHACGAACSLSDGNSGGILGEGGECEEE
jgi:hypothetical protein